jgi:uncharacterized protein (TIGR02679 family)
MTVDAERLRVLLGGPSLARLRRRVRERVIRGPELGTLTLTDTTTEERSAVDRLTGRISRGLSVRVDLPALEAILREAGVCPDLKTAIAVLDGPIEDHRALRAADQAAWRRMFAGAELLLPAESRLAAWLAELETTGLLKRAACGDLEEAQALLVNACAVLRRLPSAAIPLAELAAQTTGDTHSLDLGEPLSALLLRAAARLTGLDPPDDAESRRDVWAAVGVLCDELSAPVLVLNLPASADTPTGRALAVHAEAGEPYRISMRQLLRSPLRWASAPPLVFACENPTVVAVAADRLGPRAAPLICTEGMPKTAFRTLANRLTGAGATLLYHGDFDWPGIQIANLVLLRYAAQPWRLTVDDYTQASPGPVLEGPPVLASWSEALTAEMKHRGRAVHEEHVLSGLMEDLCPG